MPTLLATSHGCRYNAVLPRRRYHRPLDDSKIIHIARFAGCNVWHYLPHGAVLKISQAY